VRVFYGTEKSEKEKDLRCIQEASTPAAAPCIRPATSCTSVTEKSSQFASDISWQASRELYLV